MGEVPYIGQAPCVILSLDGARDLVQYGKSCHPANMLYTYIHANSVVRADRLQGALACWGLSAPLIPTTGFSFLFIA